MTPYPVGSRWFSQTPTMTFCRFSLVWGGAEDPKAGHHPASQESHLHCVHWTSDSNQRNAPSVLLENRTPGRPDRARQLMSLGL